jgi:hypothetical protein
MVRYVIKADGSLEVFDRRKVVKTALKLGACQKEANEIARKIENCFQDRIKTKQILKMVFDLLKEYRPYIKHQIDLREAIAMLESKPDFELFVGKLLEAYGYEVEMNKIIEGKCIEHEIDCIAKKNEKNIYVEVKHHMNAHSKTPLDVFLEVYSTWLDLKEGYDMGKTNIYFQEALVVCNTKITEHAAKFAKCRNIKWIAWKSGIFSLENLIEKKKLYPITFLKILDPKTQARLVKARIIFLKELVEKDFNELQKITNLPSRKLNNLISSAKEILEGLK